MQKYMYVFNVMGYSDDYVQVVGCGFNIGILDLVWKEIGKV